MRRRGFGDQPLAGLYRWAHGCGREGGWLGRLVFAVVGFVAVVLLQLRIVEGK